MEGTFSRPEPDRPSETCGLCSPPRVGRPGTESSREGMGAFRDGVGTIGG